MRNVRLWPWLLVVVLSACSSREEAEDGGIPSGNFISLFEPAVNAPPGAQCPSAVIPFPFDGLFAGFTDPTLNIPNPLGAPFVRDGNELDGFSLTASVFTDFLGFVDLATAPQGIRVVDLSTGMPLLPGTDITFTDYPAQDQTRNCANNQLTTPGATFGIPINQIRSRIQIKPLRPLKPATQYAVVVTPALKDREGRSAEPSTQFRIARRGVPVADQDDPNLAVLTAQQRAVLEVVRAQAIRPVVAGLLAAGIAPREDDIVLAWTFTTQSLGKTLAAIEADSTERTATDADAPLAIVAAPSGLNSGALGLPPVADIFVGGVDLPQYLEGPAEGNPARILTTRFMADADRVDDRTTESGQPLVRFLGQVPCALFANPPAGTNFTASDSTTTCFPVPVERRVMRVPLLVTVPNADSGQTQPASGWPVVVFQHGITQDRSNLIALSASLAAAGFVGVAIDLPLHGIVERDCEQTDSLCLGQQRLRAANALFGTSERTFDVDLVNNQTSAPGSDGRPDASGQHFINLPSLITSRDNIRQGAADLLHLSQLVRRLDLTQDGMPDTNQDRIHFVGHSLGGIVGTVALGSTERFGASVIVTAGGGIARLLDGSLTFGPRIAAGLAAVGINEGSDTYETFLRFAQQIVDDADPINYARTTTATGRSLLAIEVVNDAVVPNQVVRAAASIPGQDRAVTGGPLSGSTPLIIRSDLLVKGPITAPVATPDISLDLEGLRIAVRFANGDHGSVINPAASLDVTTEMQRQIANFLASQGTCLPIGGSCNAP